MELYVALPSSTIDFNMIEAREMEIENRTGSEVTFMEGWNPESQSVMNIRILPEDSRVCNPGFDITPARLVTGLITEKGICEASQKGIKSLFGK